MTDWNLRSGIVEIISRVFGLPVARVEQGVTPDQVAGWDSARHVELVIALEERFDCLIEPDDVPLLTSLDQIEAVLSRYVKANAR